MITKNYYSYYLAARTSARADVVCVDGSVSYFYGAYEPQARDVESSTTGAYRGYFSIFVGSGVAPTTLATTGLESEVTTLTSSNHVVTRTPIKGWSFEKGLFAVSRTFVNSTDAPITVSEAILTLGADSNKASVLARDVFTPITLNTGESVTITFHVK